MIEEQTQTDIRLERMVAGVPRTPIKKDRQQAELALQAVLDTKEYTPTMDFLRGISYNSRL